MHSIKLQIPHNIRTCSINIGEGISHLDKYIDNRKAVIVSDATVIKLYGRQFPKNSPIVCIGEGEGNKTLATVEKIVQQFIELDVDRDMLVVGIGGGIVCDVAGFAASVFMRGLHFGFVATTLLAQVDASVGGKNGVNFDQYKNMLGVFNQPDFVLCDTESLKTLPARELRTGLAEVVKAALVADPQLFAYIEQNANAIISLHTDAINYIIKRSIEIKAAIVTADEREAGERRKLNLGHTFGHAIERHSNLLHGEAVSVGMVIAAHISLKFGLLLPEEVCRIEALLQRLGLPTKTDIDKALLFETITKDKKKQSSAIHFILNNGVGNSLVQLISFDELEKLYL